MLAIRIKALRVSRLFRYLVTASGIIFLAAMIGVATLHDRYTMRGLVNLAENQNIALAQVISNSVWSRYSDYLVAAPDYPSEEILAQPETAQIDVLLRRLTQDLSILRIKIYSPDGLTIYSSKHEQIGEWKVDEEQFASAAVDGRPRSKLSTQDHFSAFSGEVFNKDVIETYVPVHDDAGALVGVFEIYADVTEIKANIDHFVIVTVAGLCVVFVLLYGALLLAVMRPAMAPLRLASERAAAIGPRTTGVRLPRQGMPSELRPLIDAVNGALDRLDKAIESQKRFTADAAHELLTPLAVISAQLDAMGDRETAAALRGDLDAMTGIVTQLLQLAELDAVDPAASEIVDARQVALEVISAVAPLAYRQGKDLALTGSEDPVPLRCCPKMLAQALRNLVDNAIAHAPAGTGVEIDLCPDGAIRVIDRGPGVPPEARQLIFRRFWRGSGEARPGAGLGLSIVKRFVDTYDGTVEVADATEGGAVFTLRLPPVEDRPRGQDGAGTN